MRKTLFIGVIALAVAVNVAAIAYRMGDASGYGRGFGDGELRGRIDQLSHDIAAQRTAGCTLRVVNWKGDPLNSIEPPDFVSFNGGRIKVSCERRAEPR